jgi:hypothetical protein
MMPSLRVALLTREYPPEVYGGAGVHVEYLARELSKLVDVRVHAGGDDRDGATGHRAWDALAGDAPHLAALRAMSIDLSMAAAVDGAEVVHSHTWYAQLAGHLFASLGLARAEVGPLWCHSGGTGMRDPQATDHLGGIHAMRRCRLPARSGHRSSTSDWRRLTVNRQMRARLSAGWDRRAGQGPPRCGFLACRRCALLLILGANLRL